ncbi:MAG: hypothetical protein OXI90_07170 [Gammaproteobacteria bacterium]|nr:hypothetical protein [Gammaproteobacteria bacterium]
MGVPATTTDANNRRTSNAYDGLGREISRTRHWDSVTTMKDGVTTTEDVKTTTAYAPCDDDNTCDAVEATIAGCGTRYSVAPAMKVTTSAPDMPDSTAYLDMFGRAIRTAVEGFDGTDRRVDAFYDARGRMVCESEPYHAGDEARYTRYTYDIRDRLKRAARPDGGTTAIAYAAASNRVTATVTETVKAANGNETLAARKTKRTHNVLGELVSTVEGAEQTHTAERPRHVTTSYVYDGAGRLKTVTTGGQTTTFAYDAAGNRESVANPNLGTTVTAGDAMVSVKFAYNGHGELTERTDARGATYYGYDKLGRRTCAADRGGTATWEYDQTNGRGLLKRRGYDRDTVRTSASNCPFGDDFAETYTYNDDARLETVTTSIVDDASATTTLTRRHAYDDYGRLSSTTYPSSSMTAVTVGYEYNRGYLAKLKHGETALVEVKARTAYGQPSSENYGNGVRTRRDYDKLGRLKDIDTVRRGTKIQDNTYAWRSDGSLQRRAARAGSGVRREFLDYDYLNRLTGAATRIGDSSTASRTLTFGYDLRGNLKTKTSDVSADDNVTSAYPTTTSNWITSATVGDVPYTFPHDTSGHIEQYECKDPDENDEVDPCADVDDTFIDWNARGLAEKVTVGESKTADTPAARDSFRYGPDGARYFKKSEWTVGSGAAATLKTSRKYYAGAYEKTVTAGGETVERTRIGDSVVHVRTTPASMMASAPPPVFEYVHRDHLGSVEAVTDQAGNELIVLAHDPYGERRKKDWTGQLADTEIESLLSAHGERVSRGFTRHEHLDRTGLIHMNGRMYDPRLGRFLSPDPIVGDPTSSQSWNLYSYVGNNPLSYVDPTGLIQRGPCSVLNSSCMHFGGGGAGGGSTTGTTTVTVTVHGVMAIPYLYAAPAWTEVWDSSLDRYVLHQTYDYFWGEIHLPFSQDVTVTIALEDQSVADEPADMGVLASIGEAIAGWWRGLVERRHAEMKADCERIHGVGGCEETLVKDLAPLFGEATGQLGAAGVGKVVVGAASGVKLQAPASAAAHRTAERLIESTAHRIAGGHAFTKHAAELGFKTPAEMAAHIRRVMANPTATRHLQRGRTAYWDERTQTVVIRDPSRADRGTVFRPERGRRYFDEDID